MTEPLPHHLSRHEAIARIVTYDHIRRSGFMRTADGRSIHFNLSVLPPEVKQPIIEASRIFNRRSTPAAPEVWQRAAHAVQQALIGQRFALEIRRKPGGKWGAVPKTLEALGAAGEAGPPHASPPPLSAANYKDDPLYPPIEGTVTRILEAGAGVAPVELLARMGWLKPEDYVRWRTGLMGCLEEAIIPDQSKCNRMPRLLCLLAEDLEMVPVRATSAYLHPSTGRPLRFTTTHQPHLEQLYSRHWERPPSAASSGAEAGDVSGT